jgi:hypothetical protein
MNDVNSKIIESHIFKITALLDYCITALKKIIAFLH